MKKINTEYAYFLMIDAFQDYMFKSTNIEKFEELCNDDLDLVYGVKAVNGARLAFYLHQAPDGSYETQDDKDTFKSANLVYLLRDFQPLVDLDRPGMFERVKKSRLDIFDYYIVRDGSMHSHKLLKTKEKSALLVYVKKNEPVWGVVKEFGHDRAYCLDVPEEGWPTIVNWRFDSVGVDYLESIHGEIKEI